MSKVVKLLCIAALSASVACSHNAKDSKKNGANAEKSLSNATKGLYPSVQSLSKDSFVPDRVFFDFDQSSLTAESRATLTAQVVELKKATSEKGTKVVVEGNCDERGGVEYNMALGEKRANASKKFLIENGIPASSIEVVSYGKERKLVQGTTPEAYAQNRAAVTVVKTKK